VQFKPTEMQYKLTLKTSEPGTVLAKLMSCKICVTMLFITTARLFYQGQKIQECGMQWVVAIKKWTKTMKLKDVM
jgi:hypothetical protein